MIKPTWGRPPALDTEAPTVPMFPPGEESLYADTEPTPLANVRQAAAPVPREPEVTASDLLAEARRDNRACPQPTRWLEFHRLLQQLAPGRALPPAPVTGSAWAATSASAKRMCFREQVEWAAANGCVHAAHQFLKSLKEGDWHYMG